MFPLVNLRGVFGYSYLILLLHNENVVLAHRGGIVVTAWRPPQPYLAGSAPCLKEKDGCASVIGEAAMYVLVLVRSVSEKLAKVAKVVEDSTPTQ